jgi:hypothetical protein
MPLRIRTVSTIVVKTAREPGPKRKEKEVIHIQPVEYIYCIVNVIIFIKGIQLFTS